MAKEEMEAKKQWFQMFGSSEMWSANHCTVAWAKRMKDRNEKRKLKKRKLGSDKLKKEKTRTDKNLFVIVSRLVQRYGFVFTLCAVLIVLSPIYLLIHSSHL